MDGHELFDENRRGMFRGFAQDIPRSPALPIRTRPFGICSRIRVCAPQVSPVSLAEIVTVYTPSNAPVGAPPAIASFGANPASAAAQVVTLT